MTTAYASLGNIYSFPQTVTIYNGAGTQISKTTYNYDGSALATSLGTPQHVAVSGSRGNLTSVNFPADTFTASSTYFDTGTVQTATDVNGAVTTYNFPDATSTCGNAFPTSVSEPMSLTRYMTWNCTGGVQVTAKDEDSQTVTTTYNDPYFWRPNIITDQLGNQMTSRYQPNAT